MRLRSKREPRSQPEPLQLMVAGDGEIEPTTNVTWTVEQLNALGPVTGPSHRTFVPIVRSTVPNISLGDPMDTSVLRLQS
jgi:hypothetical protein